MSDALNILRNRTAGVAAFRRAAAALCEELMGQIRSSVEERGIRHESIVVVLILRAGVAFFGAAARAFPNAPFGVLGLKRDDRTLDPRWYYENLPLIAQESAVIIADPMLATGGSAEAAVERLVERGAEPHSTYFVGIVAAPEGYQRLAKLIPEENIVLAAIDRGLDGHGMIVPGVGDFGDRYFGYEGQASIMS